MKITSISDILQKIRDESSTNRKVEILSEHKDNMYLTELIRLTYNPFILMGRTKHIKDIHVQDYVTSSTSMTSDDTFEYIDKIRHAKTDQESKDIWLEMCKRHTSNDINILYDVLNKDLRLGMGSTLINKAYGYELIPKFKVQLANPLEEKRIKSYPCKYYVTPKLDGVRCMWVGGKLYSRQGKVFKGLEHIEEECRSIQDKYGVGMLDGELYIPNKPFEYIQSVVSKEDVDKSELEYWVFALPSYQDTDLMNKDMFVMSERREYVQFLYACDWNGVLSYMTFNSYQDILEVTDSFIEGGWEGCMLRSPTQAYDWKRSDALIKCKKFLDTTLKIVGMEEGTKKNKGKLGAFICEGEMNDGTFVSTKVGSGFSDIQREEFWNDESLIGRMVDVKYQSISKSKTSDIYSLRFPVFVKWRNDIE